MSTRRFPLLSVCAVLGGLAFGACGGGSPAGPGPGPTPEPGFSVTAVAFYDENGDGALQASEPIRIPDVELTVAGRSARTERGTGRAVIAGVPAGTHAVGPRAETLPPFFAAGPGVPVTVPQAAGATTLVPLTLPIGDNRPNVFLAFGDSLTRQESSPVPSDYPRKLEAMLVAHFGGAEVSNQGRDGTNSFEGMDRIRRNISAQKPAYTLVLYGTNDWHAPECQEDPSCTSENLRRMVREVKAARSLPFLATLPPVNPALNPPGRNDWIRSANDLIRAVAREEGAFLVDLHPAFMARADVPALFVDPVHPSDAGYQLIAAGFFEAIAHGRSTATRID